MKYTATITITSDSDDTAVNIHTEFDPPVSEENDKDHTAGYVAMEMFQAWQAQRQPEE